MASTQVNETLVRREVERMFAEISLFAQGSRLA